MFDIPELKSDPTLLLDLPLDVREECEKLGTVTNVILYDLEPDGIMTVKYQNEAAATACVKKMNGRFFAGRKISAYIPDKKPKFKRSRGDEDDEERDKAYEQWLEQEFMAVYFLKKFPNQFHFPASTCM